LKRCDIKHQKNTAFIENSLSNLLDCETRGHIASILKNYKMLLTSLDITQEGYDEYCKGKWARMEQFGLKLVHQLFAPAEQCSTIFKQ